MPKDFGVSVLVFIAVCGFSFFSIWFSVFVENNIGFSVLSLNMVCIRFWMIFSIFVNFRKTKKQWNLLM